jgi:hypothetical protein
MKDLKLPSHNVDVVEIMKKIRQSASRNRAEFTAEDRVKREARSEFLALVQSAQVPDFMVEEIRQQTVYEPYDPRTLYSSSRSGVGFLIGLIRKILKPITKLLVNLDPMAHQVNRLTILNNFYLRTVQDLIVKNATMRVEIHSLRSRQHHRPRNENQQRFSGHRRPFRDRHGRREAGQDSRNQNSQNLPQPAASTEEPTPQS